MQHYLDLENWNLALMLIGLLTAILLGIRTAKQGRLAPMRQIPAVDALSDAVGLATEKGRPVYYVAGVRDLDDVQTVASLSLLGTVAEIAARHDCRLWMPTDRSLVMSAAREVCREAHDAAARPDSYRDEMVSYISDEQFAFAMQVDGMIARERPAALFLLGAFYSESLLLAEAGSQAGAVTIAGTAHAHQLPFLVAACDHVLIGEEFFAASAYLTRDPVLLGSLRGQDLGKFTVMALLVIGSLLSTAAVVGDWALLDTLRDATLRLLEVR